MIKNILHITLFASALALQPAAAQPTTPPAPAAPAPAAPAVAKPAATPTGLTVTQPRSLVVYRPARVVANAAQTTTLDTTYLLPLFNSAGVTIPSGTVPRQLVVTFYKDGSSILIYVPATSLAALPNPPVVAPTR